MPIPQRSIASVYAVYTSGALSVWSPVNFRDGSRAKAVLTTPRNTPSELCARSTRACLLSWEIVFSQCGSAAMAVRFLRCN